MQRSIVIWATGLLAIAGRVEAQLVAGPERSIGTPVYVAAPDTQAYPGLGFNGTNFLLTWTDYREPSFDERFYGTLLDRRGTVEPATTFRVLARSYSYGVASDGVGFLSLGSDFADMRLRYVDGSGTPAPTNSLVMRYYSGFDAAWNGGKYLLAWTTETELRGAWLDRYGVPADTNGFLIATSTNYWGELDVEPMGDNWLVVWAANGDVSGAIINPQGTVGAPFLISGAQQIQRAPTVSCSSNACLVLWLDTRPQSYNYGVEELYAARISTNGTVLDPAGVKLTSTYNNADRAIWDKSLRSDGTNWMLLASVPITSSDSRIVSAQITPQLAITWNNFVFSTSVQVSHVDLAFTGTNYQAIWEEQELQYTYDIRSTALNLSGVPIDPAPHIVTISHNRQYEPAAASDGTNFFVVWSDGRRGDGRWDIYGARINPEGELLDPEGFAITTLYTAETAPSVAFDGTCYLVAWEDTRASFNYHKIYAARVSLDGRVLDTNGFPISNSGYNQFKPAVGSTGQGGFRVGWAIEEQYGDHMYTVPVSSAGLVGAPQQLTADGVFCRFATDGTNYLIHAAGYPSFNLLMNNAGVVLGSNLINGAESLAGGPAGYLALYDTSYGIFGQTLNFSSLPTASFELKYEHYHWPQYTHAAAANRRDFLMMFSTDNNLSTNLYLTQVTRAGRIVTTNGIVAASDVDTSKRSVLSAGGDRYLLLYTRNEPFDISRLHYRILSQQPELRHPRVTANGFSAQVHGPAERAVEVEMSTDFQSWDILGRVTNSTGVTNFSTAMVPPSAIFRLRNVP